MLNPLAWFRSRGAAGRDRGVRGGGGGRERARRRNFSWDALEARVVLTGTLPDAQVMILTALDPKTLSLTYDVFNQALPDGYKIRFGRSADAVLSNDDLQLKDVTLTAAQRALGRQVISIPLDNALGIDPTKPFVVAQANFDGTSVEDDLTNNTDAFRKYVVGAFTHGLLSDPTNTAFVTQFAAGLKAQAGYDQTIGFLWADTSTLPIPGQTEQAAARLADSVRNLVTSSLNLSTGDVVDIHLIGHSRGANVVAMAAAQLGDAASSAVFRGGFQRVTLADPHPGRNISEFRTESASTGPLGRNALRAFQLFQAGANDPIVTIAPSIDQTDVLYQWNEVAQASMFDNRFLNSWGVMPIVQGTAPVYYHNLTGIARDHIEVLGVFQNLIPTLRGPSGPYAGIPTSITAPVPPARTRVLENPQSTAAGRRYDQAILANSMPASTARGILDRLETANRSWLAGRHTYATVTLSLTTAQVNRQIASGVIDPVGGAALVGGLNAITGYYRAMG